MPHPDWDLDPGFLTVNHGSFGATPRCVTAAQRAWQDRMERQPTRFMTAEYPNAIRSAAADLADFLNAEPSDVAFVDNATTGCNAVLRSLRLARGETIVILSHAYGAVRNAVRHIAEQAGATVVEARIPFPNPDPATIVDAVAQALTPATKLAVIDHVTSPSALVMPLRQIVSACHAAGVPVLVDGAHGPGQVDVDLTAIGADCYVGNCHKWLCAPKGCGFIHARHQQDLHPAVISHGLGRGFTTEFDWTGTTDPTRFLAVTEALAHHQRLGGGSLRARNAGLAAEATALVARRLNSQPGATGAMAGAMGTIRLPVSHPTLEAAAAIRSALMQAGTDAPVHALDGAVWLRLSAFAYNEIDDYVQLAEKVASVLNG